MATSKTLSNHFYTLLIIAGVLFVLTASSYWIQTLSTTPRYRSLISYSEATNQSEPVASEPITITLANFKIPVIELLLFIELLALLFFSITAMWLDYRQANHLHSDETSSHRIHSY